ncbi:MAG TPA: ImmA/IrrE family metallo-endopeptidase [Pyrinomonadaceae bacterium]|jgi:Zn-dependent peptidase ImmA (M78 family)
MKTLERGFKAWAERTSLILRKELEIKSDEQLNLAKLAEYLNVKIWTPNDIPGITDDVITELLEVSPNNWYGIGLQFGKQGIVIYNPKQSARRQASDIAHELAHFLLEHQPAKLILSSNEPLEEVWMRSFDQKQEDEANCLAWSLLLPRDGLIRSLHRMTEAEIAEHYGVSEQLVKFRINSTGIKKQIKY